ncbi:MAG: ion channel [Rikenellaceae bacterium]
MAQLLTSTKRILDPIVVVASVVLLIALSVEILGSSKGEFSTWYINMQGIICLIFLVDFFMIMFLEKRPWVYLFSHIPILIISLPYLWLLPAFEHHIHREWSMLFGLMPQLRSFLALYIVLRWIVKKPTMNRLFYAYILTVATLTYIAALLFYNSEIEANEHLSSFGDAIWWAAMGLTTVGATITPITVTGKILAVVMPLMGMMMLPIATSYLINIYKRR